MWPKLDVNDPLYTLSFNPTKFWLHGGPQCFEHKLSTITIEDRIDLSACLSYLCDVEIDTADDVKVHQTTLYHLNLKHVVKEISELDHLQLLLDQVKQ
jgi:hypothetical protein